MAKTTKYAEFIKWIPLLLDAIRALGGSAEFKWSNCFHCSVRSEIFVATRATPLPSPVPPSFHSGAAGRAAVLADGHPCGRHFWINRDGIAKNEGKAAKSHPADVIFRPKDPIFRLADAILQLSEAIS